MVMTYKTKRKFQPKWEGPFVVESVYSNGAYCLIIPNSDTLMMPINSRFLKNNRMLLMIRLTLHLWLKLSDPRCLKKCQRKVSFFNGSHYSRSLSSRLNTGYILMHDVNIEEKTKCETLFYSCYSSSSLSMNIWRLWRLKIEENVGL